MFLLNSMLFFELFIFLLFYSHLYKEWLFFSETISSVVALPIAPSDSDEGSEIFSNNSVRRRWCCCYLLFNIVVSSSAAIGGSLAWGL